MEFYHVNWCHYEINVVFTGQRYIFINSDWAGLVAIAERQYVEGNFDKNIETFILTVGNNRLIGGNLTNNRLSINCRRFITKIDQRYVEKEFNFSVRYEDLSTSYLTIQVKKH